MLWPTGARVCETESGDTRPISLISIACGCFAELTDVLGQIGSHPGARVDDLLPQTGNRRRSR
jgi:hypothetical protein